MFVALSTNNTQLYVFNTSSLTVRIYFIKRTIRYTHVQFKIIKMKNKKISHCSNISKVYSRIVQRGKLYTFNTHIHFCSLQLKVEAQW